MKTVYLIRHGEANANVGPRYEGGDSALTEHGKKQAQLLAMRAKRLPIDVLISSPMRRTRETAEIISKHIRKPIEFSEIFEERHIPTALDGRKREDADATRLMDEWCATFTTNHSRILDGENFADIYERAGRAISFLEKRPEDHILMIGHGFFSKMIIARIFFGDTLTPEIFRPFEYGMRTKNTGLSILQYNPDDKHKVPWWLSVWNDHTHLG